MDRNLRAHLHMLFPFKSNPWWSTFQRVYDRRQAGNTTTTLQLCARHHVATRCTATVCITCSCVAVVTQFLSVKQGGSFLSLLLQIIMTMAGLHLVHCSLIEAVVGKEKTKFKSGCKCKLNLKNPFSKLVICWAHIPGLILSYKGPSTAKTELTLRATQIKTQKPVIGDFTTIFIRPDFIQCSCHITSTD